MKINFDASFEDSTVFSGIILRNPQGSIIIAWTSCSIASTPFAAEAEAALQALRMAKELSIVNLILEGDALNVIYSIKGENMCLEWKGKHSILRCRKLLSEHCFWSLYHVFREKNRAAHNLAKWAKNHNRLGYIDPELPPPSVFCDRGGTQVDNCTSSLNSISLNEDG